MSGGVNKSRKQPLKSICFKKCWKTLQIKDLVEKKISVSRILNGSLCVELRTILLGDRNLVPMLYMTFLFFLICFMKIA